ncbi:MAG TPA: hypothetical protein VF120_01845 [Ktedonobacterales bacterium]
MSVQRPSRPTTRPVSRGFAVPSTPLSDVEMYRPGPYLALTILLIPVVVTVIGAAISLNSGNGVPLWLPFAQLLWFPCLALVWLGLLSVRADSTGIAAGRPFGRWSEVRWDLIERVEKRGPRLRITGSSGAVVVFLPSLLRDGDRLTRRLLLRLPTHVLAEELAYEAQQILTTSIYTMPEGGLSGVLRARPRVRFRLGAGLLTLLFAAAGVGALSLSLGLVSVLLASICWVGAAACATVSLWLSQIVLINDKGVTVIRGLMRGQRAALWTEIGLVEHSTREAVLRFHGQQRVVCIGPGLLPAVHRDLMRAFLHEYCLNRQVPIVKRRFLFFIF